MRRNIRWSLATVAGVLVAGLAVPAAADGVSFTVGAGFAVGGASFHVAYATPHSAYPQHYYRTAVPLRYGGYACSSHCLAGGGYWYHTPDCPLVGHHFDRFGYAGPFGWGGYYPAAPYYRPPAYFEGGYYPAAPGYGHAWPFPYGGFRYYGGGYKHRYGHQHSFGYGPGYGYGYGTPGYGYGYKPGNGHGYGKPGYGHGYGRPGHGYGYGKPGHGHAPGAALRTRPTRD